MGKFSQFKLPLKSLQKGEHSYSYRLDKEFFKNMESADVRDANVDVSLTVTYSNDVYALCFNLKGVVTVPCDRCLDDLQLDIDTGYSIKVKYGDTYSESDDLMEIPESDNYLNVAYMIYDTVSLAIPIKHVHQLGKCNKAMSALLKKHRASLADDSDSSLEEELIDEIDAIAESDDAPAESKPTDPRWDKLKDLQ